MNYCGSALKKNLDTTDTIGSIFILIGIIGFVFMGMFL